jgi:hypothetical protein
MLLVGLYRVQLQVQVWEVLPWLVQSVLVRQVVAQEL